jgi:hypothetical protein
MSQPDRWHVTVWACPRRACLEEAEPGDGQRRDAAQRRRLDLVRLNSATLGAYIAYIAYIASTPTTVYVAASYLVLPWVSRWWREALASWP